MKIYVCTVCGFSYNETTAEQDSSGTPIPFNQLESDWACPNCGVSSDFFNEIPEDENSDDYSL